MRIRDLLDQQSVCLNAAPVSKEAAIATLADFMAKSGCISDVDSYREAVFERERKSSTGLGEGIAIPHAKSDAVLRPGLASMVVPNGVDFDSIDGEPVQSDYSFTAKKEQMEVEVSFTFNASALTGKNLVTFEELYDVTNPDEPVKVTEHKDITDEGQTVTIKEVPEEPEQPDTPETPETPDTPETPTKSTDAPKTGDTTNIADFAVMLGLSAAGIAFAAYRKFRSLKRK